MTTQLAPHTQRLAPILEAAEVLYAERGHAAVSIADVAERVGLPEQKVYNYVGCEQSLYLACLKRARQLLRHNLDQLWADPSDPSQQLTQGLLTMFEFIKGYRDGWFAVIEAAPYPHAGLEAELAESQRETIRLIAQLIAETREQGGMDPGAVNTETTAYVLVGAIDSIADWWRVNPDVEADQIVRQMALVLWGGLPAALAAA